MGEFDLAALRAARREARGDAPVLSFDDRRYELLPEIPWSVVESAAGAEGADAQRVGLSMVRAAFGSDEAYESFIRTEKPSVGEIEELVKWLSAEYGAATKNGDEPDPKSPPSGAP